MVRGGIDEDYFARQDAKRAAATRRRRLWWIGGTVAGTLLGLAIVALVAFVIVPTVDRNNERRGRGDADVADVDDSGAQVIQFPDRFSNVASKCDGYGHRIFVTTKSDSSRFMVVVDDPTCNAKAVRG